jgi:hypothetical protein
LSENDDFSAIWNDAIQNTVAGMSDPDLAKMGLARLQATPAPAAPQLPPDDVAHRILANRNSIAAKAAQLQAVPRDANGALGSMQAAIDATGGPTPLAQPATPEPVAQQGGWAPNRAQGASSSDFVPITESDRNKALITDILNNPRR